MPCTKILLLWTLNRTNVCTGLNFRYLIQCTKAIFRVWNYNTAYIYLKAGNILVYLSYKCIYELFLMYARITWPLLTEVNILKWQCTLPKKTYLQQSPVPFPLAVWICVQLNRREAKVHSDLLDGLESVHCHQMNNSCCRNPQVTLTHKAPDTNSNSHSAIKTFFYFTHKSEGTVDWNHSYDML